MKAILFYNSSTRAIPIYTLGSQCQHGVFLDRGNYAEEPDIDHGASIASAIAQSLARCELVQNLNT